MKAFLSHRYGQRTLPNEINHEEFKILIKEHQTNKQVDLSFESKDLDLKIENLMVHCYRADENDTSKKYLLIQADEMIENYQLKVKKLS